MGKREQFGTDDRGMEKANKKHRREVRARGELHEADLEMRELLGDTRRRAVKVEVSEKKVAPSVQDEGTAVAVAVAAAAAEAQPIAAEAAIEEVSTPAIEPGAEQEEASSGSIAKMTEQEGGATSSQPAVPSFEALQEMFAKGIQPENSLQQERWEEIRLDPDEIRTPQVPEKETLGQKMERLKGWAQGGIERIRENMRHTAIGAFVESIERSSIRFIEHDVLDQVERQYTKADMRAAEAEGRFKLCDADIKALERSLANLIETGERLESRGMLTEKARASIVRDRAAYERRIEETGRAREAARLALEGHNNAKAQLEDRIKEQALRVASLIGERIIPHEMRAATLDGQCEQFRVEVVNFRAVRDGMKGEIARLENELRGARFSFEKEAVAQALPKLRAELKRTETLLDERSQALNTLVREQAEVKRRMGAWTTLAGDFIRVGEKQRRFYQPDTSDATEDETFSPEFSPEIESMEDIAPKEYAAAWNVLHGSAEPIDSEGLFPQIEKMPLVFEGVESMVMRKARDLYHLSDREIDERKQAIRHYIKTHHHD